MSDTYISANLPPHISFLKNLKKPVINHEPGEKWYEYDLENEKIDEPNIVKADKNLENAEELSGLYLKIDTELYESKLNKKSEAKWLVTVFKEGTQSDKKSAVQLKINLSPVHSLRYLNSLVDGIQKKALRESSNVLQVLVVIFDSELLPPDRKLIPFNQRPFFAIKDSIKDKQIGEFLRLVKKLIIWKFESDLKKCYEKFVRALESLSSTSLEGIAEQACKSMANLLIAKKEQEKFLLESLVNKLGHPNRKIGTSVCRQLENLAQKHSNMRMIIIDEVERLIFRKNISEKAQLYGVHFLSRILLQAGEAELAVKLLKIYFNLFKILLGKEEKTHRILTLLFIGMNRALPYAKEKSSELAKEVDSLYNLVHTTEKLQISLNALKLLFQLSSFNEGLSDRFYSSFYRKLNFIHSSSNDRLFFNLLMKVLKHDLLENRIRAFLKRLFQLSIINPPSFAAESLLLCSRLIQERPKFKLSPEITAYSFKADSEVVKKFESDDEEEHYKDVKEDETEIKKCEEKLVKKEERQVVGNEEMKRGWTHRVIKKAQKQPINRAIARNPLFCKECSLEPELRLLAKHYHPSVAVFAENILNGISINYSGDPLVDFTIIRFLDRFSFKNPKANAEKKVGPFNKNYEPHGVKKLAPTSEEYISKKIEEIPIDERYLHRFTTMKFAHKLSNNKKKEKKKSQKDDEMEFDDVASIQSEEFDLILNKFEPGERNEEFEMDFSQELVQSKLADKEKKKKKRRSEEDEIDDLDDEEFSDEEGDFDEMEFSAEEDDDGSEMEEEGIMEEDYGDQEMDSASVSDEDDDLEVNFGEDSEEERPKKRKKINKPKGFKKYKNK